MANGSGSIGRASTRRGGRFISPQAFTVDGLLGRDRKQIYGETPTGVEQIGTDMSTLRANKGQLNASDLVWRYLQGGKRRHALVPGYALGNQPERWQPACGIYVLMPNQWLGASRDQRAVLQDLEPCKNCRAKMQDHAQKF